jgi:nucleoside-diphosphate-sugar epimerase
MKKIAVIFGGAGYIGTHLTQYLLNNKIVDEVVIGDIQASSLQGTPGVSAHIVDVRKPIATSLVDVEPSWIFNLAAIHREPGHEAIEYFDTNLKGAENVCVFAESVGCKNIYFTSSISVYGPTPGPTPETAPICPISPYGGSKYPAELIHQKWLERGADRRLIIVRPGVVYGPKDPGNIGRMVAAIQKGYFAFPGSMNIFKSYGYVYGLMDSISFTMTAPDRLIVYNYVETPTETLGTIARHVQSFSGSTSPIFSLPTALLMPAAHVVQAIAGSKNPVHPVRVKKASMPTHIVPQKLIDMGFTFKYSFLSSLAHWQSVSPEDFPNKR